MLKLTEQIALNTNQSPNDYCIRYWTIQQNGEYVQQYYYIPLDLLQPSNVLVLIEELGMTDLSLITLAVSNVQVPSA